MLMKLMVRSSVLFLGIANRFLLLQRFWKTLKRSAASMDLLLRSKCLAPTSGARQNTGIGKIYIKYAQPESAQKALAALAGRKFADRTVVVTFFGEEYFDVAAW